MTNCFYVSNINLFSEPKCPGGNKPVSDKPCDTANPLSCGADNNCYQYLSPADPDSTDGRICCKSFQCKDSFFDFISNLPSTNFRISDILFIFFS